MKITTSASELGTASGLLIVPVGEKQITDKDKTLAALKKRFGYSLATELKRREFKGAAKATALIHTPADKKIKAVCFVGWPKSDKKSSPAVEDYRLLGAAVASKARAVHATAATLVSSALDLKNDQNAAALLEGIELSAYRFSKYKKDNKVEKLKSLTLTKTRKSISTKAKKLARANVAGTVLARDLVNTPGKDCKPRHLVAAARKISKGTAVSTKVYDKKALTKMGAGALLSVAAGSDEPPYLIKMSYKPSKKNVKDIAIVGKGITFDSGGLSIKPGAGMMEMKMDMGGAAAVLGAMQAIAILNPSVAVTAYIPTSENMINGKASRPGDIVKAINGKTIEVLNTDAEGRLILADALSLASKEKHDAIIDLATLTGAVIVALGEEYAGLFSNSDSLADALSAAADTAGENVWRLPLAEEYESQIKGSISDVKNIGKGRWGGSITAALFLKQFVTAKHWAHLDIAGPAFRKSSSDYRQAGGVGFGVRTLVHYLLKQ